MGWFEGVTPPMPAAQRLPWACADCDFSNLRNADSCEHCGGTNKITLYPVRETNQMQNTASWEELCALLHQEEASRPTEQSVEEQIAALYEQFAAEQQKLRNERDE